MKIACDYIGIVKFHEPGVLIQQQHIEVSNQNYDQPVNEGVPVLVIRNGE